MTISLRHKLMKLNMVLFVTISVLLPEMLTSLMNILQQGRIADDYLITGGIVPLSVSAIVIYIIMQVVGLLRAKRGCGPA